MKPKTKTSKALPEGKRVFSSMSAAATGMQIPLPLLRRLKAAGSPGFELNGRCREAEILKFTAEHAELLGPDHIAESYDPLKRMQIEKLKFDLAVRREKYVEVDKVKTMFATMAQISQDAMKQFMTTADFNACIRLIKANGLKIDL
jgi:hypothetical protein